MTGDDAPGALSVRGLLTLVTICAAQFMISLDFSIVTVALPAIDRSLGFGGAGELQWVMTAFILPTAGLLLLFGRLSDFVGRRRLFVLGLTIVTGFSLLAGLADAPWVLVTARAGQGFGSAMVGATALALLITSFPEGRLRNRALGVSGALLSLGFVVGTIGGGIITSGLSWRATMLILVVLGALALVGAVTLLPADTPPRTSGLDPAGALLATAGLLALVYGISTLGERGLADPLSLVPLLAAAVLLAAFLWVESRHRAPLVPLPLLRRPSVMWGGLTGFVTFGTCGGATVLLSLYMQEVLGWSPLTTGVAFLGEGLAALLGGALAPRLIDAAGRPNVLLGGLLLQAAGTGAMVLLPPTADLPLLTVTTAAMGFGHVLAVVSFIGTMTAGVSSSDQGLAGGLAQTAQQVGGAVGVAALAVVAAGATVTTAGLTAPDALLGGLHVALGTAAAATLVAALAALLLRGARVGRVSAPGQEAR